MGLFPKIDVEAITATVEARFNELVDELRALGVKLDAIAQAIREKP